MDEAPRETWTFFGKHQCRVEPPDVYFSRLNGDVSADDMRTQLEMLGQLAERTGKGVFWLCDVHNMGTLSQAARRLAAEASKTHLRTALCGSAIFGASFTTRVMVTLLARAIRVLNPSKTRPIAFVETESQARAFLTEQRNARSNASVSV